MSLLLLLLGIAMTFAGKGMAGYILEDSYTPDNFFSMFDFFTASDPTDGFVRFLDQSAAQAAGLIETNNNSVYMGVDHTNIASAPGRASVRLTSTKAYNHALIILDAAHMPQGCGTWPAFWTVGPNWPHGGEIDIIEGVNSQSSNAMTLHTGPGCQVTKSAKLFAGAVSNLNCDINAPGQPTNAGCGILATKSQTYGTGFNSNNGGVYAMEWTSGGIAVYFFPRGSVPGDITSGTPTPSAWPTPLAMWSNSGCPIDTMIKNQQIVFDTTFCGGWASAVWASDSTCSSKASTCEAYVANNPSAFANAYWSINSLKVYQDTPNTPVVTSPAASATTPVAATSTTLIASVSSATSLAPTILPITTSAALTFAPVPTSFDTVIQSTTVHFHHSYHTNNLIAVATDAAGKYVVVHPHPPSATPTATAAATTASPAAFVLQANWFPDNDNPAADFSTGIPQASGDAMTGLTRKRRHLDHHRRRMHGHAHGLV